MNEAAFIVRFQNEDKARKAYDMLMELGYKPNMLGGGLMDCNIERQDVTSALEIIEAYGGEVQDDSNEQTHEALTPEMNQMSDTEFAYLSIPAHTVNEDLDEDYMSGYSDSPYTDDVHNRSEDSDFDASFGGFSGSVKA
ncbi:hypothetical protein M3231_18070 [Neobacillus mesonae]|nr:hypothetical protein [Neobacillus mesonae]